MNARTFLRLLSVMLLACIACGAAAAEPLSDSKTVADKAAVALRVFPEMIRLRGKDSRQQVLVSAVSGERTSDVTRTARFAVDREGIVQVDDTGVATPLGNGSAKITVSYGGVSRTILVEITEGDSFLPIDFQTDIIPILTRRGCNGGGCHGKSTGRGGFRLSLFGYNPEADYWSVTHDAAGRRISPQDGANSLLLQKPSMAVGHGGGLRLRRTEPEFQRLVRWIENNAPRRISPTSELAATLDRISIEPEAASLRSGEKQQIAVTAFFADGSSRDVTKLVTFHSNDTSITEVDEWGLVTAGTRLGETAVTATYAGQVAVCRVRIPLDREWTDPEFPIQNFIDRLVLDRLKLLRVPPSTICGNANLLRRATLQIAGRLPTPLESASFAADQAADSRQRLVKRLLDDPGYADHFAQKWSDILRNKRRGERPRVPGTIAFHRWIRNAIALNVPYDKFVREILTATGNVTANPPVQWYAEVRYLDRYVDDTAQAFLGMRIGCARCHHHPFEQISQDDYYGFAAFFSRVARKGGTGVAERRSNEAIFVKPTGKVKHPVTGVVVLPHGLGGPELTLAAYIDPREELVNWMVDPGNRYFARAFVNRMWAHFFGHGLVDPLDDLRATNPATNDPLLNALAREFVKSGFDMKHIVNMICTSTTYQLSSTPNEYNLDETQNFSRFYPQRLHAEVLLDAIDQVTGVATGYRGLPKGTRALQLPDEGYSNQFLTLFGRPPRDSACECERPAEPSLSQSLFVMNDKFILGKVSSGKGLAAKLAADKREPAAKIRDLFHIALTREPTARDLVDALDYLKSESDQKKAFGNLLWTLLNTKEFLYVH